MLFHHIVTMVLLGWSYEMGYHRIGVLVLICHDISDVFLDSAKCFHYIDMVRSPARPHRAAVPWMAVTCGLPLAHAYGPVVLDPLLLHPSCRKSSRR